MTKVIVLWKDFFLLKKISFEETILQTQTDCYTNKTDGELENK